MFDTPSPEPLVAGGALLCLGAGILVPVRLADWLLARRILVGPRCGVPSPGDSADPASLLCPVMATLACAAGFLLLLAVAWVSAISQGYRWVASHFLWTPTTLGAVRLTVVISILFPGLSLLGLTVRGTIRLGWSTARHLLDGPAWALLGAAGGSALATLLGRWGWRLEVLALAAAVPAWLGAVLLAGLQGRRSSGAESARSSSASLPESRDEHPVLLRSVILWLASGIGALVVVWDGTITFWSLPTLPLLLEPVIFLLIGAAVGMLLGTGQVPLSDANMNSAGRRCLFGGACLAGSVIVPHLLFEAAGRRGLHSDPLRAALFLPAAFSAVVVLGSALRLSVGAVARRSGSPVSSVSALLAAGLLLAAAITLLLPAGSTLAGRPEVVLSPVAIGLVTLGICTTQAHRPVRTVQDSLLHGSRGDNWLSATGGYRSPW